MIQVEKKENFKAFTVDRIVSPPSQNHCLRNDALNHFIDYIDYDILLTHITTRKGKKKEIFWNL